MSQGVAPSLYFRVTWQLQIVLAGVLMIASGVGRPMVVLPYLMLAFLLVSPLGFSLRRWRRALSLGLGTAIVTSFVYQTTTFSGVDGFVTALIELITGALPLLMLQANERRSQWLGALNIVIIAVGSISLASSPLVYATFIAFMVVYLLGLNAANLHLPDESGQRLTGNLNPGYFRQFF